jgi:hypothetical protein
MHFLTSISYGIGHILSTVPHPPVIIDAHQTILDAAIQIATALASLISF